MSYIVSEDSQEKERNRIEKIFNSQARRSHKNYPTQQFQS